MPLCWNGMILGGGKVPILIYFFMAAAVVLSAIAPIVDAVAAVPVSPLAEVVFAPYNPNMTGRGKTPDDVDDDFCFISHGCWGGRPPQRREQSDVAALIARLIDEAAADPTRRDERIRFVVAAGDNFYKHGVRNVYDKRFFTTFENFYSGSPDVLRVPWLVALGNHDYYGNWWAQVNYTYAGSEEVKYRRLWRRSTGSRAAVSGRWYLPHPYYAVKVSASMVVVVIDTVLLHRCSEKGSLCWDGGRQKEVVEDWLLRQYADVPYKVVVGHYPVLSNGPHENFKWLQEWLVPLMAKSCASIYIHADNHYLQVSKKGFQYYANSGGGAGLTLHYPQRHNTWVQEESIFHAVEFGVMLHCKRGDKFTHRVLSATGEELFRFASLEAEDSVQWRECLAQLKPKNNAIGERGIEYPWLVLLPPLLVFLLFLALKRRGRIRVGRCV